MLTKEEEALLDTLLTEEQPQPLVLVELGADIQAPQVPFTPGRGQR